MRFLTTHNPRNSSLIVHPQPTKVIGLCVLLFLYPLAGVVTPVIGRYGCLQPDTAISISSYDLSGSYEWSRLANLVFFRFMIRILLHLSLHLFKCRCFALGAGDPLFRHKLFFNTFKELLNMLKTLGYFIPMSTYVVGFNLRGLLPFILVISNAAPQASIFCSRN